VDVTLGPWTAAHPENKPLADVMGKQAKATVDKAPDWTAKELPKSGNPTGYSISGKVMSVVTKGGSTQVSLTFTVLVDGALSNSVITATGAASGTSTAAEDAVGAITDDTIQKILQAIKSGRIVKQG
jgi:hypothetical protein